MVICFRDGTYQIIEGDVSKCDHSVRLSAIESEMAIAGALGMPIHSIEMLLQNQKSVCVIDPRKPGAGEYKVYRETERNTGGTNTTFGNSVVIGMALCSSLINDLHEREHINAVADRITAGMAEHGFEMKIRAREGEHLGDDVWPPSFLKGTWWLGKDGGWHWGPLLSRILKLSKIMSDPRKVYKLPNLRYALRVHAASVALAMAPFCVPDEIRSFLSRLGAGPPAHDVPLEEFEDHKVKASGAYPLHHSWRTQAAEWYGVDEELIDDWLKSLERTDVGKFNDHPLWPLMAARDYG